MLNLGGGEGNYLESSCAAMFTYAFAKGANEGYLNNKFLDIARDSFKQLLSIILQLTKMDLLICTILVAAGLKGNPYREGSFEYYISVPKTTNDFKGYGPLIFAALELEERNLIK